MTKLIAGQKETEGSLEDIVPCRSGGTGKRALVIGEQIAANSLRALLYQEFAYTQVDVVSYFQMHKELMQEGDRKFVWESEWRDFLEESGRYDLVIGDPVFLTMLPYKPGHVIPLPHIAVSSRAFWDQSPNLFGEKGSYYISRAMQE